MSTIALAERGWLPDATIRFGIRRLLTARLHRVTAADPGQARKAVDRFADQLRQSPIVIEADRVNEQHYEVPARFYQRVLGHRMKYSCAHWPHSNMTLDEAEDAMLDLTCRRAQINDGMDILELGCGWGSFSLWIAEKYPRCRVLCLSNSHSQRQQIEHQCQIRDLKNIDVVTCNIAEFQTQRRFDRVISIEMFEHVRNYERLLEWIAGWLRPDGKLFVHIFCHRSAAYSFDVDGKSDWMARHFFTGGIMPSANLLGQFQDNMKIQRQWHLDGTHYSRTCEAWLRNLDRNHAEVVDIFRQHYDASQARIAVQRWRMFFMACSELFNFRKGNEWHVGHYLLERCAEESSRPVEDRLATRAL